MNVEIDKKDRRIIFSFGTADLEKEMFNLISKKGNKLMKTVNNYHQVKRKVSEELEMKTYCIKRETKK